MSRFEIWAATPTPFDADGRLDVSVIEQQVVHLQRDGVVGAFVTGTTGEFAALSVHERRQMVEAWAAARPDGFGLGVQVGGGGLAQDVELAAHARDAGADLVASVAPFYGEAPTVELVIRHLEAVASAAGDLPFCYYHIPSMTGSTHLPGDVVAAARERIPTLAAVKYTAEDLMELDRLNDSGIKVYFGRDELLPAGLAFGARAVIGSLFNSMAPIAHQVVEAYDRGEHERAFELHRPFRLVARTAQRHGGLGFVKELMNRLGPQCGSPRSPWGPLASADLQAADQLVPDLQTAIDKANSERERP